jgi:hypothetical protein
VAACAACDRVPALTAPQFEAEEASLAHHGHRHHQPPHGLAAKPPAFGAASTLSATQLRAAGGAQALGLPALKVRRGSL